MIDIACKLLSYSYDRTNSVPITRTLNSHFSIIEILHGVFHFSTFPEIPHFFFYSHPYWIYRIRQPGIHRNYINHGEDFTGDSQDFH